MTISELFLAFMLAAFAGSVVKAIGRADDVIAYPRCPGDAANTNHSYGRLFNE